MDRCPGEAIKSGSPGQWEATVAVVPTTELTAKAELVVVVSRTAAFVLWHSRTSYFAPKGEGGARNGGDDEGNACRTLERLGFFKIEDLEILNK